MTASSGDHRISRKLRDGSSERPPSIAVAAKDDLTVNVRVTYAPLAVWKDFHWTCAVTSFAPLVPDRLE